MCVRKRWSPAWGLEPRSLCLELCQYGCTPSTNDMNAYCLQGSILPGSQKTNPWIRFEIKMCDCMSSHQVTMAGEEERCAVWAACQSNSWKFQHQIRVTVYSGRRYQQIVIHGEDSIDKFFFRNYLKIMSSSCSILAGDGEEFNELHYIWLICIAQPVFLMYLLCIFYRWSTSFCRAVY